MSCDVVNSFPSPVSICSPTDPEQNNDRVLCETELQQSENQVRFETNFGQIDKNSDAEDVQIDSNVLAGKA